MTALVSVNARKKRSQSKNTKSEVKRLKLEVKKVSGELKLEQERAKVARAELLKIWLQGGRDLDDFPSNI